MVLVCMGDTLEFLLKFNCGETLALMNRCTTTVCYRSTPAQKALAVRCVKLVQKKVCLAVGDGANDVSMILQADVGVGIVGKEGAHAAMSADYIAVRFEHLQRLLLVHGRWALLRSAGTCFTNLYKSMAFPFTLYIYSFVSGANGSVAMDDIFFSFTSLLFSSLVPLCIGIFDQDVTQEHLLRRPQLYAEFRAKPSMAFKKLFYWLAVGIYQSSICFISFHVIAFEEVWVDGLLKSGGMVVSGNAEVMCSVLIINIQMTLAGQYIPGHMLRCAAMSIFLFFVAFFILSATIETPMYGVAYAIFNTPSMYFVVIFCIVTAFLPAFIWNSYCAMFNPDVNYLFKEAMRQQEKEKKTPMALRKITEEK